jgi:hypothetical protein
MGLQELRAEGLTRDGVQKDPNWRRVLNAPEQRERLRAVRRRGRPVRRPDARRTPSPTPGSSSRSFRRSCPGSTSWSGSNRPSLATPTSSTRSCGGSASRAPTRARARSSHGSRRRRSGRSSGSS